jgi:hypothetical protein
MSGAISPSGNSTHLTLAAATSEFTAIPTNSSGKPSKYCLISVASGNAYWQLGTDHSDPGTPVTISGDASLDADDGALLRPNNPLVIKTIGWSHIFTYDATGTNVFVITPLEGP